MRYIMRRLFILVLAYGLLFCYSSTSYGQTITPVPLSVSGLSTSTTSGLSTSTTSGLSTSNTSELSTSTTGQPAEALLSFCGETNAGALDIEDSEKKIGEEFTVAVLIQGAPNKVFSFGFDLTFNPQILNYVDYKKTPVSTAFDVFDVTEKESGRLRIGGYDTDANAIIEGIKDKLVLLKFKVVAGEEGWSYPLILEELKDDVATWSSSGGCLTILTACDGDLNLDGSITPSDALSAFKCYLGSGECGYCPDINNSGEVTPSDALCLFQTYLGLPSCLQVSVSVPPTTGADAPSDVLVPISAYRGVDFVAVKPIVDDLTIAGAKIGEIEASIKRIATTKLVTEKDMEAGIDAKLFEIANRLYSAFNAASKEAQTLADSEGKKGSIRALINYENTVRSYQARIDKIAPQIDNLDEQLKTGAIKLDKAVLENMAPEDLQEYKSFLTPAAQEQMIKMYPTIFTGSSSLSFLYRTQRVARSIMGLWDSLPNQMSNFWVGEAEAELVIPCIAPCAAQNWPACAICILTKVPSAITAYNDFIKKWNGCCKCKWNKPGCCLCKALWLSVFIAQIA